MRLACHISRQPKRGMAHRSLPITGCYLSAEVFHEPGPDRVVSYLAMSVFGQPVKRLRSCDPFPPVWRMKCLCSFRAGRAGEIASCGCRFWWRVGKRGRWYAISKRRAFRALLPVVMRELGYFEVTGDWPRD